MIAGANELASNKQLVDAMNVFPVPDGDTGTNMSLTVMAAAREAEKNGSLQVADIAKAASGGALRGARGNSGVITSQIFRGFAKALEGMEEAGVQELAAAAEQAVKTAYKAVMKPKEGTILTVARGCAEAAVRLAEETDEIEVFLKGIIEDGHKVLAQTPEMLPVLKQAGVVDAGGRGLLYILEGALKQLGGDLPVTLQDGQSTAAAPETNFASLASVENESITFGYCTEFFINVDHADEGVTTGLKAYLGTIGDSIVCVADDDIIKIHVHTDHPGLAIEKALTIGSLSGLKIDNMREQHTNKINFSAEAPKVEASNVTAAEANAQKAVAEWNSAVIQAEIDAETKAEKTQIIIEQLANMRKEGALMVANKELSEKQKEKVEKEINYMFYELYTKRMSAEAAQEIAKATYEKVKNEYELGKGHLSNEEDKNLREWIYGGIREGVEIIKIITDFLPAGKAAKVLKTIRESWNNKGDYSKSITTQTAE